MKIIPNKINLLLLTILSVTNLFAAPSGGSPPPPTPPPPPGLPIDAGVVFLLLAGLIYGLYVMKTRTIQIK